MPELRSYICRRVKDDELAADIMQDVFLRIFCALKSGKYTDNRKFSAWIYTVACNLITDSFRRRVVRQTVPLEDFEQSLEDLSPIDADEKSEQEARISAIHSLIPALPDVQRRVVSMRLEGRKFEEIATAMAASLGTTLGRWRYAVGNLKAKLYKAFAA